MPRISFENRFEFACIGIFVSGLFSYLFWSLLTTPPLDLIPFKLTGFLISVFLFCYFIAYLVHSIKNGLLTDKIMNRDIADALIPFLKRNDR